LYIAQTSRYRAGDPQYIFTILRNGYSGFTPDIEQGRGMQMELTVIEKTELEAQEAIIERNNPRSAPQSDDITNLPRFDLDR
jgi:hypothetical protein